MLRKTILFAGITCLMLSCSNNEKKEVNEEKSSGIGEVIDNVSNLNKISQSAGKIEELVAKLKKETPLTNDELKAVVPETLDGLKRKSYSAGNLGMANLTAIDAEYSADDVKRIKVNIMDGAGETGSAVISMLALSLSMDRESESNGTVSKTKDINGIRSMVEDTKSESAVSSSIKFLYKDRYSINLDGEGYTLDELAAFSKKLDLSSLK